MPSQKIRPCCCISALKSAAASIRTKISRENCSNSLRSGEGHYTEIDIKQAAGPLPDGADYRNLYATVVEKWWEPAFADTWQ
jgi:hypothetical protein